MELISSGRFRHFELCVSLNAQVAARQTRGVVSCIHARTDAGTAQCNLPEVHKGLSKVPPGRFATDVGVDVPPHRSVHVHLRDDIIVYQPAM